jgi:cytochrome c553
LPNGLGRPENASLAGLPAIYIRQQMADYKSGARKSSVPELLPQTQTLMTAVAKAVTEPEIDEAAAYFAALKPTAWIKVVETNAVPKTHVEGWMLVPKEPRETELVGIRIIETAEDLSRTELRDARSGFVAYVPNGSIKRGEALVTTGGSGRTVRCAICHGPSLQGLGPVPALAGRSPSYIVRQLYDFKARVRRGVWAPLMEAAVANLSEEDFVAIAAYTASRTR